MSFLLFNENEILHFLSDEHGRYSLLFYFSKTVWFNIQIVFFTMFPWKLKKYSYYCTRLFIA